eukprot:5738632-Alexandrium_andersonii.AAC.1
MGACVSVCHAGHGGMSCHGRPIRLARGSLRGQVPYGVCAGRVDMAPFVAAAKRATRVAELRRGARGQKAFSEPEGVVSSRHYVVKR